MVKKKTTEYFVKDKCMHLGILYDTILTSNVAESKFYDKNFGRDNQLMMLKVFFYVYILFMTRGQLDV